MRTLLQIVQAACDELGSVNRPTNVVSSSDQQVQQLLSLANREGKALAARAGVHGGWPQLRKLHTITTVADQANYAFPSDLQYFVNTTAWDRAQKWPMRGPISPQEWQVLKSGTIGSIGPRTRFRIMAEEIYFDPTPDSSGDTLILEYYSDTWCESAGGTAQRLWAADTDMPLLPDDCFILGLIWRFRRAKGLDYQEAFNDYEDEVTKEIGRAGMAPVIDMTGERVGTRFIHRS
jgi:hypothetical protein